MPRPVCSTTGSGTYNGATGTISGPGGQCTSVIGTPQRTVRPTYMRICWVDITAHPLDAVDPTNANGHTDHADFPLARTSGTGLGTVYYWGPGTFATYFGAAFIHGHTYRFMAFAFNSTGWSNPTNAIDVSCFVLPTVVNAHMVNEYGYQQEGWNWPYYYGQAISLNCDVYDDGGGITSKGIIWCPDEGADANITLTWDTPADVHRAAIHPLAQAGSYVANPTDYDTWLPGHKYKIRAYATNTKGTAYGETVHIPALPPAPPPNRVPTVAMTSTPRATGPHTVRADAMVTDPGIEGGVGSIGVIRGSGFLWTVDPAVAASDSAFKMGQPNVVQVPFGVPNPETNWQFGMTFDVQTTYLPQSEVEGGTVVWIRAYARNVAEAYGFAGGPGYSPVVTPVWVQGARGFALDMQPKANPSITLGGHDHVRVEGYEDVPFESGTAVPLEFFPMFADAHDVGPHVGFIETGWKFEEGFLDEVEDLTLHVGPPDADTLDPQSNNVTLSWRSVTDASSYRVFLLLGTADGWTLPWEAFHLDFAVPEAVLHNVPLYLGQWAFCVVAFAPNGAHSQGVLAFSAGPPQLAAPPMPALAPSGVQFEQDSDPGTTHATKLPVQIIPDVGDVLIHVQVAGKLPIEFTPTVEPNTNAYIGESDRTFALGTSPLGKTPLGRVPARRVGPESIVVRSYDTLSPPPPEAPPPLIPATPQNVAAKAVSTTSVLLTWDANIESDLVEYAWQRAPGEGRWLPNWNAGGFVLAPTHQVLIEGLTPNTLYDFHVAAGNYTGHQSPWSGVVHARTPEALIVVDEHAIDLTGNTEVSEVLTNWLSDPANVPPGADADHPTHVVFQRSDGQRVRLWIEGGRAGNGLSPHGLRNVIIDFGGTVNARGTNGALLFQTMRLPYAVRCTPGHDPDNLDDSWDVVFLVEKDGDMQLVRTLTGNNAYDRAVDVAAGNNHDRCVFRPHDCTNVDFYGFEASGAYVAGSGYRSDLEGQAGFDVEGCVGCGIGAFTIHNILGDGIHVSASGSGPEAVVTTDLYVRDGRVADVGRQCLSMTWGARLIWERIIIARPARSVIDVEPNSDTGWNHVHNDPAIEGVYLLDLTFGEHDSAGFGLHAGVRTVLIRGCTGTRVQFGAICYAENVLVENNTDTNGEAIGYPFDFGRAAGGDVGGAGTWYKIDWGGINLLVRNNRVAALNAIVHFRSWLGRNCSNFKVVNNTSRIATRPQYVDEADTPWHGTFDNSWLTGDTLPIPAHPFRST